MALTEPMAASMTASKIYIQPKRAVFVEKRCISLIFHIEIVCISVRFLSIGAFNFIV